MLKMTVYLLPEARGDGNLLVEFGPQFLMIEIIYLCLVEKGGLDLIMMNNLEGIFNDYLMLGPS